MVVFFLSLRNFVQTTLFARFLYANFFCFPPKKKRTASFCIFLDISSQLSGQTLSGLVVDWTLVRRPSTHFIPGGGLGRKMSNIVRPTHGEDRSLLGLPSVLSVQISGILRSAFVSRSVSVTRMTSKYFNGIGQSAASGTNKLSLGTLW